MENCTVFGNGGAAGAGICMLGENPRATTIIWSNHPLPLPEIFCDTGRDRISWKLLLRAGGLAEAGNTTEYPLVIDPGSGYGTDRGRDYQLQAVRRSSMPEPTGPWMQDAGAVDLDRHAQLRPVQRRADIVNTNASPAASCSGCGEGAAKTQSEAEHSSAATVGITPGHHGGRARMLRAHAGFHACSRLLFCG